VGEEICLPGADKAGCPNVESLKGNNNCKVYIVQQGDTLNSVAASLDIYSNALSSLNQDVLTNGILQPNKYLKLPPWSQSCGDPNNSGPSCRTYIVTTGDFIAGIASAFRVTADELLAANQGLTQDSVLQNGQPVKIPPFPSSCGAGTPTQPPTDTVIKCRGYLVKPGDNLQSIAQLFKTTVNDLNAVNPELGGGGLVQPGTTVKVPPYDSSCDKPIMITPPSSSSSSPAPAGPVVPVVPVPVMSPITVPSPIVLASPPAVAPAPVPVPAPVPAPAPAPEEVVAVAPTPAVVEVASTPPPPVSAAAAAGPKALLAAALAGVLAAAAL
jgi:LysM repeat protein